MQRSAITMSDRELARAIQQHERTTLPALTRLWAYYRNPALDVPPHRAPIASDLAQAQGLPERLRAKFPEDGGEVVIENDIAWRVHAMVDFMFGKPITIRSTARDPALRATIDRVLARVLAKSGGVSLLQELALLGHVYGYVDLLVNVAQALRDEPRHARRAMTPPFRANGPGTQGSGNQGAGNQGGQALLLSDEQIERATSMMRIDVIEPRRGFALLDPGDYRTLRAFVVRSSILGRDGARIERMDVITGARWQKYRNGRRAGESEVWWSGGRVPIVHIQNLAQPFRYEGIGEVEPLIPLQDELNTRLSDRAHRLTMQSFRVYLARGFDPGQTLKIAPGSVIVADSADAKIEEFGGSTHDLGEDRHIGELREALDKASAVPPIAAGAVQAKFGNLSSGNALRIALMGVVAKTSRKRITYGAGLAQAAELVLSALDAAGVLPTASADREIEIDWPETVPGEESQSSKAAEQQSST